MRPTDENQAASTRPNLMSSRRGAGEDNILAMLERDSARRPGTRMSGLRLASYGAAAALAGILAGGVAWLAYDNHQTAQELQARHDAASEAAPTLLAEAALPPHPPSPGPAPAVEAPRTAVIVDEAAPRPEAPAAAAVPPLVMLPPQEVKGAQPTPPAPRPVPASVPPPAVKAEAPPPAPRAAKKTEKAPTPAGRAVKPAPSRTAPAAKARLVVAARARKAVQKAEAAVDTDVALISAIIAQAERHRGEREALTSCGTPACPPAKAARP